MSALSWLKTTALTALTCCLVPAIAQAQSIEVEQLGAAQNFDAGTIGATDGGLDPDLWQNTSADMAEYLLSRAPINSKDPLVRALIRSAVLTGGVPPKGAGEAYAKARLRAVTALTDQNTLQMLARRSTGFAATPQMRTDLALASGDIAGACATADTMSEGRSLPYWAKLRAFCHVTRDEIAAAELTANLLRNSGYEDDDYFALLNVLTGAAQKAGEIDKASEPIYAVMLDEINRASGKTRELTPEAAKAIAISPEAKPTRRLEALFQAARSMTNKEIEQVLAGILFDQADPATLQNMGKFDYASAAQAEPAKGFAQLFFLIQQEKNIDAAREFLARADEQDQFSRFASLIKGDLAQMPVDTLLAADIKTFTRVAILDGDIGALQGFYRAASPDSHEQARIALAADALGNGFQFGQMGEDIEIRLTSEGPIKRRAQRDAFVALGLGAIMSDKVARELEGIGPGKGRALKVGDLAAIKASANNRARAETALRAAILLEGSDLDAASFAAVIEALTTAQLTSHAGKLAARDFLADL